MRTPPTLLVGYGTLYLDKYVFSLLRQLHLQAPGHWHNFALKSGGDQWRRQVLVSGGHDDQGAKGAE